MINVILALELSIAQKLKQNLTRINTGTEEDPVWEWQRNDLTSAQRKKLDLVFDAKFRNVDYNGDTYVVLNFFFPEILNDDGDLLWLEKLKEILPGKEFVIGAWQSDGYQMGTYKIPATYDADGAELTPEGVGGSPVYPLHSQYLKAMPDDVTYDDQGNETSRTPATQFKQVHKISGWADRRI